LQTNTKDQFGYNAAATSVNTININGGTLNFNIRNNNKTATGVTFNMTGGTISSNDSRSLVHFFTNPGFGNTSLNTLASPTTAVFSTGIGLREDNPTITVAKGTTRTGVDLQVSGVISDFTASSTPLIKAGAGAMQLTGANTFARGLSINAGTVMAANSNSALGTGTVTLNGGRLQLQGIASGAPTGPRIARPRPRLRPDGASQRHGRVRLLDEVSIYTRRSRRFWSENDAERVEKELTICRSDVRP